MLQINYIRQNTAEVKERLAVKHFKNIELVDELLQLDEALRLQKAATENLQASVNSTSKEIGMLMGKGDTATAEQKKQQVASLKTELAEKQASQASMEENFNNKILLLPNLPHSSVPPGKTPEENVVVREGGTKPTLIPNAQPHWELIKQYDLVDFETGAKITGSGFPLYKGKAQNCSVH